MQFNVLSLLSFSMATLASAQITFTKMTQGAIFSPGNNIIPVNEAYNIIWTPTTSNTISLVLLNHVDYGVDTSGPQLPSGFTPIIQNRTNTGVYTWTPPPTLAPFPTGYAIRLVDDKTGEYQNSLPFGISNPTYSNNNNNTSSTSTTTPPTTAPYPITASNGFFNSTIIQPTGTIGVPSSLITSIATTTANSGSSPSAAQPSAAATTTRAGSGAGRVGAGCGAALLGVGGFVAFIL